jgi:hypothetical protein
MADAGEDEANDGAAQEANDGPGHEQSDMADNADTFAWSDLLMACGGGGHGSAEEDHGGDTNASSGDSAVANSMVSAPCDAEMADMAHDAAARATATDHWFI